jgi:menaquinol-cytochrome c reductase iron-sulfur subunit
MPDAEIFLCPCHGGVYNKDGSNAAGPPPKKLNRYPIRINNSIIEILTSPVPML